MLPCALLSFAVPAPSVAVSQAAANASPVVFAFTGGDYDGYQQWDWDTITHLGFWTKPSDDVRALAKKHGVKLGFMSPFVAAAAPLSVQCSRIYSECECRGAAVRSA